MDILAVNELFTVLLPWCCHGVAMVLVMDYPSDCVVRSAGMWGGVFLIACVHHSWLTRVSTEKLVSNRFVVARRS